MKDPKNNNSKDTLKPKSCGESFCKWLSTLCPKPRIKRTTYGSLAEYDQKNSVRNQKKWMLTGLEIITGCGRKSCESSIGLQAPQPDNTHEVTSLP